MLLDTGAAISAISYDQFQKLPQTIQQLIELAPRATNNVVTANGTKLHVRGTLTTQMCLGKHNVGTITFVILDNLNIPLIFGANDIKDTIAAIDMNDMKIILKDGKSAVCLHPMIRKMKLKVNTITNINIPANSEIIVYARAKLKKHHMIAAVEAKPDVMILEPAHNIKNGTIQIARCIVNVHKDDVDIPVNIINASNVPVTISKGAVIGQLEPLNDDKEVNYIIATLSVNDNDSMYMYNNNKDNYVMTIENNSNAIARNNNDNEYILMSDEDIHDHDNRKVISISPACNVAVKPIHVTMVEDRKLEVDQVTLPNDIIIPEYLNKQQQEMLKKLLIKKNKLFAIDPKKPGVTRRIQHRVLTGDHPPLASFPYRTSNVENETIDKEVAEMLKNNVAKPSKSPWSSPVVLVKKKDGSTRFCIDYRKLNKITKRDVYPLPRIDDTLNALTGAKWFSSIDLASGYWQIEMNEEDKEKTAFVTRNGLYEFNVMPFGLTNAPATFQRLMDMVLAGYKWKKVLVYFDDILIYSDGSFEKHLDDLSEIMDILIAAELKAKAKKCTFAAKEVHFLGHIVSGEGIKVDPAKVAKIKQWPVPRTVKQVESFIGLASYYRRFVPDFATISAPINSLKQKNKKWNWTDECQRAFELLKQKLCEAPIVRCPNNSYTYVLQTDASQVGIGAVLSQRTPNGEEYVIEYASRTLNKAERNYSTIEKECLAIIWAVCHFRVYLFGIDFIIQSDHKPLRYLSNMKDLNGRLTRWSLKLQEYNFIIEYRKGSKNGNADALSRYDIREINHIYCSQNWRNNNIELAEDDEIYQMDMNKILTLSNVESQLAEIKAKQHEDQVLKTIIDRINNNEIVGTEFVLDNGVLYNFGLNVKKELVRRLAVPDIMRSDVMKQMHDDTLCGHLGIEKTYRRLIDRFWWPNMYKYCADYIKACKNCQSLKQPIGRRNNLKLPLMGMPVPSAPFELIGVDTIDKLPTTPRNNKYIIVFTDYLTKWPEAFALPDIKAETIADTLVTQIICRHGVPKMLLSDRGKSFIGDVAKAVYDILNIKKLNTTAYHPQTNGLTERFNGTLVKMLGMYCNKQQNNWDIYIPYVLFAYRTSHHKGLIQTPFYLLYGREATLPTDIITRSDIEEKYKSAADYSLVMKERLNTAHETVKQYLNKISKHRNDIANEYPSIYKEGDLVNVKFPTVKTGMRRKLTHQWRGPYVVVKQLAPKTYQVKLHNGIQKLSRSLELLKPYHAHPDSQHVNNDMKQVNDSDEEYVVERVIDVRDSNDGGKEYLVKWKGYPMSENTWEPAEHMMNAQRLIDKYWQQQQPSSTTHQHLSTTINNEHDTTMSINNNESTNMIRNAINFIQQQQTSSM